MRNSACATLLLLLMISTASADIIEDDVVFGGGPTLYGFSLGQSIPDGMGLFSFSFNLETNGDIVVSYNSIAELVAIYEVDFGTRFDSDYAINNDPLSINDNTFNDGIIQVPIGDSFYVAYFDDRNFYESGNPYGPDDQDNFGWAKIMRTDKGLELLSSATRIDGGIIVGSTSKIPEPSVTPMAVLLALIFPNRKRWR